MMKLCSVLFLTFLLVGGLAVPTARGWIISQDQEQLDPSNQTNIQLVLSGHVVLTGGGKSPGTNPFASPARVTYVGGGSAAGGVTKTGVRFFAGDGSSIPTAPGAKQTVGCFGEGPNIPAINSKNWSGSISIPSISVSYQHLGNGNVQVTLSNLLDSDSVQVSQVGYRILKTDSFTIENMNAVQMPGASFTSAGVADGTIIPQNTSVSFTVGGVTLLDDIVVHATAQFVSLPAGGTSGCWAAWNSGTYIPARKAFLGRVPIRAVPGLGVTFTNPSPGGIITDFIASGDVALRTPFKVVTPVIGPAARAVSIVRADYDPGSCVPNGDQPGAGCNSAFGNQAKINKNLNDLLLDTTGPGGLKLSYVRTGGADVYTDVRAHVLLMPGASTTTTNAAASDDFGGPVAIRIGPTGGSYFASLVTGRRNQIDLMRDSVDGATQTSLATATQWANGDPILLNDDVPNPVPDADVPPPYVPVTYDVTLQAIGSSITLIVTQVNNAAHTVTLGPVVDTTYTIGYVGLRTQRNGEALSSNQDATVSRRFETVIRDYKIEDPTAAPTLKAAMILEYDTTPGDPADNTIAPNGLLGDSRIIEVISDHAVAELLRSLGFQVDEIKMAYELDYFTHDGDFIINPNGALFHPIPLNNYDLVWYSGTGADQSRASLGVYLTKPLIFGEHIAGRLRKCNTTAGNGAIPAQPGDVCPSGQADAFAGMYDNASGDVRFSPDGLPVGSGGQEPSALRILPASGDPTGMNGDPTHPIVAGLSDGTGTQRLPVYAEPWAHMVAGGSVFGAGVEVLSVLGVANGDSPVAGASPPHLAWGIVVADPGDGRIASVAPDDNQPNPNFAARTILMFVGDHMYHRLAPIGREIVRRGALWATNQPIPTSGLLYYGDFDEDGDVDDADFAHLRACRSGTGILNFEAECADADFNGDGKVDALDNAMFALCYNGSGNVPNFGCPPPRISILGPPPIAPPAASAFDFNHDGVIDKTDMDIFLGCFSGPAVPRPAGLNCEEADADGDGDVDMDDFGRFQSCYSGTDPASPNCR